MNTFLICLALVASFESFTHGGQPTNGSPNPNLRNSVTSLVNFDGDQFTDMSGYQNEPIFHGVNPHNGHLNGASFPDSRTGQQTFVNAQYENQQHSSAVMTEEALPEKSPDGSKTNLGKLASSLNQNRRQAKIDAAPILNDISEDIANKISKGGKMLIDVSKQTRNGIVHGVSAGYDSIKDVSHSVAKSVRSASENGSMKALNQLAKIGDKARQKSEKIEMAKQERQQFEKATNPTSSRK